MEKVHNIPTTNVVLTDLHAKTRTLSDAELIRGGAEYQGGVLKPTATQVGSLAVRREYGSVLAIHSSTREGLSKSPDQLLLEAGNAINLKDRIDAALMPYVGIFDSEYFAITGTKSRKPSYETTMQTGSTIVDYEFTLKDGRDRRGQPSKQVTMNSTHRVDPFRPRSEAKFLYTNGRLVRIEIKCFRIFSVNVDEQDVILFGPKRLPGDSGVIIELGDNPKLKIDSTGIGADTFREELAIDPDQLYAFDPSKNKFTLAVVGRSWHNYPAELSVDDYIRFVEFVLSRIPTVKSEY